MGSRGRTPRALSYATSRYLWTSAWRWGRIGGSRAPAASAGAARGQEGTGAAATTLSSARRMAASSTPQAAHGLARRRRPKGDLLLSVQVGAAALAARSRTRSAGGRLLGRRRRNRALRRRRPRRPCPASPRDWTAPVPPQGHSLKLWFSDRLALAETLGQMLSRLGRTRLPSAPLRLAPVRPPVRVRSRSRGDPCAPPLENDSERLLEPRPRPDLRGCVTVRLIYRGVLCGRRAKRPRKSSSKSPVSASHSQIRSEL